MLQIANNLAVLMQNINETQKDLNLAHEGVQLKEKEEDLIGKIKDGSVAINYETGELSQGNTTISVSSLPDSVSKLQSEVDPAVLHLDVALLRDIVTLSLTTAAGGKATKSSATPICIIRLTPDCVVTSHLSPWKASWHPFSIYPPPQATCWQECWSGPLGLT